MGQIHESGCFVLKKENGIFLNKLPRGVRQFRVHFPTGVVRENFSSKVFFFNNSNQQLEVIMDDGECRFFEYHIKEKKFVELGA